MARTGSLTERLPNRVQLFAAPWLIPLEGPPVEGGALVVSKGRILAAGPAKEVAKKWPGAGRVDLDGCALLPALINCHCHLELTGFGAPPEGDFSGWLLEVIRRKRTESRETVEVGLCTGLRECQAGGQGTVADVLSFPGAARAYPADGPEVRVFPEVIAASADHVKSALERAVATRPGGRARIAGLSPHSPYTACEDAYRECWRQAHRHGGLVMTHVAETAGELEFCVGNGQGFVGSLYADLAVSPPPSPALRPISWLEEIGVLDGSAILVHCVHLTTEDVDRVARRGARVVLCPRSNRRFGSARAPGRAFLDTGVRVGLGTDSRLSAGDLDLWKDVACAVEDYGWSPSEAVAVAARGGAAVLGSSDRGTFAPGKRADIVAMGLGQGRDLWDRLLSSPQPAALWLGGARAWDPEKAAGSGQEGSA